MADARRTPATPDAEIQRLRKRQKVDRKRRAKIEREIKQRGEKIEEWRKLDKRIDVLDRRKVIKPWLVYVEAERAEAAVGELKGVDFVALLCAVLERETGIPQRNIFGCDHGPQGGSLPFCNDDVTKARCAALVAKLKDPDQRWDFMNGVGWTQLTWYEKVLRADRLAGGVSLPVNQLRVGAGDLAVLVETYGLGDGVRRYNGSGDEAEEYRDDVVINRYPRWKTWND